MPKKLTITVDSDVYDGLRAVVGPRGNSRFLNELARRHVAGGSLDHAYREMARDEGRERDALDWTEGLVADITDEPR